MSGGRDRDPDWHPCRSTSPTRAPGPPRMHDDRALVLARLARVLEERVRPAVHRTVAPLEVEVWHVEGGQGEPVPPSVALGLAGDGSGITYEPARVGDAWGRAWGTSWFHLTGQVPAT